MECRVHGDLLENFAHLSHRCSWGHPGCPADKRASAAELRTSDPQEGMTKHERKRLKRQAQKKMKAQNACAQVSLSPPDVRNLRCATFSLSFPIWQLTDVLTFALLGNSTLLPDRGPMLQGQEGHAGPSAQCIFSQQKALGCCWRQKYAA